MLRSSAGLLGPVRMIYGFMICGVRDLTPEQLSPQPLLEMSMMS